MKRLVVLTAGAAFLLSAGCAHDGEGAFRKALGGDRAARGAKAAPAVTPPSPEVAKRVELVGWKVAEQNTFTGLDPAKLRFMTLGVKERVLFHRGTEELFISEGVVEKCQTDAELAAVLCAEMGKMVAEKTAGRAVRRGADPAADAGHGGPGLPGGTAPDGGRPANPAARAERPAPVDPVAAARDLLKGAGYSPAELDRVEALLKPSERGEKLRKQMAGSAPAPTWQK